MCQMVLRIIAVMSQFTNKQGLSQGNVHVTRCLEVAFYRASFTVASLIEGIARSSCQGATALQVDEYLENNKLELDGGCKGGFSQVCILV